MSNVILPLSSFGRSITDLEEQKSIREAPIILMDPIKPIHGHKFTFSLNELSKNPNRKAEYKKNFKEKNNITTSQGRPIFTSNNIYRHYLKTSEWKRASQLPAICAFFERATHCHQLSADIGTYIHPEFVLWATSANGL
jgi:hypothetical protein